MSILVSACLVGVNCKYCGGNNYHQGIIKYLAGQEWIPVCPEQLGGLATPRPPAEIIQGDGDKVLRGEAKVMTNEGKDVTGEFIKGAYEVLKLAQLVKAEKAIFKARSPSCGKGEIYDGSFSKALRPGSGVTVALLKKHGFQIYTEKDF